MYVRSTSGSGKYKKARRFRIGLMSLAERPGLRPSGTHQSLGLTPMFIAYKKALVFRQGLQCSGGADGTRWSGIPARDLKCTALSGAVDTKKA